MFSPTQCQTPELIDLLYHSLQDNHINDRGAEALSDALRHNVTLEELE